MIRGFCDFRVPLKALFGFFESMGVLSDFDVRRRQLWIEKIRKLGCDFASDSEILERELQSEISQLGKGTLLGHLRLSGDIPESYGHDSSEEKLYSKYTDILLSESFKSIGLKSLVLKKRADVADVELFAKNFSFVADAKTFRLSRTAKNQKDFKIQAVDGWRRTRNYAMVVCPIYQLPGKSSQIYEQASSRNVCIFTYSHLAMLIAFSEIKGNQNAEALLEAIFKIIPTLNPSKNAYHYWYAVNKTILDFSEDINALWRFEKQAAVESIDIAKKGALDYLARERERIMRMSHEKALEELIKVNRIDLRIKVIGSVSGSEILSIGS